MNNKKSNAAALEELYAPYKKCLSCPLGKLDRKTVVFGQGDPEATFMIIGEAPGKEEDEQGIPFVGKSGRFLTKILTKLNIDRKKIFITNSVKCRPPNNRKPTKIETQTCTGLLLFNEINIIQPKVICTLGSSAAEALLKTNIKMQELHGKPLQFGTSILFPTYHPAYVMRNPKKIDEFVSDLRTAYSICNNQ